MKTKVLFLIPEALDHTFRTHDDLPDCAIYKCECTGINQYRIPYAQGIQHEKDTLIYLCEHHEGMYAVTLDRR